MKIEEAVKFWINELSKKFAKTDFVVGHSKDTIFIYEQKHLKGIMIPIEWNGFKIVRKYIGKIQLI